MEANRTPLVFIVENVFPFLENIVTCQISWDNFDETSKAVCFLVLRCFNAAIFIRYDEYFTLERFKLWMFFVKRVLDQKLPSEVLVRPSTWNKVMETDALLDWKLKRTCGNIICKYCLSDVEHSMQSRSSKEKAVFTHKVSEMNSSHYMLVGFSPVVSDISR